MKKMILYTLIIGYCLFSLVSGLSYYWGQILSHPVYLWIFIPDCPLYVLLGVFAFVKIINNEWLNFIISVGLAKYALWTLFIFGLFNDIYFIPGIRFDYTILLTIGHVIMFLFPILIIPKKISHKAIFLATGWFLINDFADYYLLLHPIIPEGNITLIMIFSVVSTLLIPIILFKIPKIKINLGA